MKQFILLLSFIFLIESAMAIEVAELYDGSYQSSTYTSTTKAHTQKVVKDSSNSSHESKISTKSLQQSSNNTTSFSHSTRLKTAKKDNSLNIPYKSNIYNRNIRQNHKNPKYHSHSNKLRTPTRTGNPYNKLNSQYSAASTQMSSTTRTFNKNILKFK